MSHGLGAASRKRNTPTLVNATVFRSNFDWDGRAATLMDQLRGVFSPAGDMGIDLGEAVERTRSIASYDAEFRRVLGRAVDVEAFVSVLIAFQQSLRIGESRFDRYYLGGDSTALTAAETRGWHLFRSARAGCGGCHVPLPDPEGSDIIIFSDNSFHNLGIGYRDGRIDDVGLYAVTHRPSHWGAFRTPSLANVAITAPYMHDGSLGTLEAVIDFYANGGIGNPNLDAVMVPRHLTPRDRADLVAFLGALTTNWLMDTSAVRERILFASR